MIETPQISESTARLVAYIPLTVARSEIQKVMGPGIQEVLAVVAAQEVGPDGAWFTHHLRMSPEVFDFEICVPVKAPVTPTGRVLAGETRATRVARTVLHGGYEGLAAAWGEFNAWIEANGHKAAPDLWEVYVTGPESGSDQSKWRTELHRPLID